MPDNRATVEKQERRRQRGSTVVHGQKLTVNEAFMDRKNFEYRWINDDGGRIEQMTQADDWDLVIDPLKAAKADSDGLGAAVSKVVGRSEGGQAMRAYLAKKPKHFYAEDQAEKRKSIKQTMDAIKGGNPAISGAPQLGATAYVPGGASGISIKDELQ